MFFGVSLFSTKPFGGVLWFLAIMTEGKKYLSKSVHIGRINTDIPLFYAGWDRDIYAKYNIL